jgi:hypothetical protein
MVLRGIAATGDAKTLTRGANEFLQASGIRNEAASWIDPEREAISRRVGVPARGGLGGWESSYLE